MARYKRIDSGLKFLPVEANLKALAESNIDALIADNGIRQRDERFADQAKHKAKPDPLWDKSSADRKKPRRYPDRTPVRQVAFFTGRPASLNRTPRK